MNQILLLDAAKIEAEIRKDKGFKTFVENTFYSLKSLYYGSNGPQEAIHNEAIREALTSLIDSKLEHIQRLYQVAKNALTIRAGSEASMDIAQLRAIGIEIIEKATA